MSVDTERLSRLVEEVSELDDSALSEAVRRVHRATEEASDPIAAFGAFNQHSSSPW